MYTNFCEWAIRKYGDEISDWTLSFQFLNKGDMYWEWLTGAKI